MPMTAYPYEIHLTVKTDDMEKFKRDCAELGLKYIVIVNTDRDGNEVMTDVMTSRAVYGELWEVYKAAFWDREALEAKHYGVVRTKFETVAFNENKEVLDCKDRSYWESHITVLVDQHSKAQLKTFNAWRLSRKHLATTTQMMTFRCGCRMKYPDFQFYVDDTIRELEKENVHVVKSETELVFYDSNPEHDLKWTQAV